MAKNKKSIFSPLNRVRFFFLALVILASSFTGLVFNSQSASAAINYKEMTDWNQKFLLWEYARIFEGCYLDDDGVETDYTKISAGQFFYENDFTGVKPATFAPIKDIAGERTSKNALRCGASEGAFTKTAFQKWQIDDKLAFACSIGYVRSVDGADCKASDSNFKDWGGIDGGENRASKFRKALKDYTGIDLDDPGDEILYLFARQTLLDVCTTGIPGADGASGVMRYNVNEIVDGKSVVTAYTGGLKTSDKIYDSTVKNINTPFGWNENTTCLDVMNKVGETFVPYWNSIQDEALDKACRAQGYINSSASSANPVGDYRLTACKNGFNYRQDPGYCTTTYQPVEINYYGQTITNSKEAEREACNFGAGLNPDDLSSFINQAAASNGREQSDDESAPTCVVDSIGWIVCPLMGALGGMADAIYAWIDSILLTTPLQQTDGNGGETVIYKTWQNIRDIANVLLVIAFFIIIISQVTSMGVSNYGIKKTLPRIVIAAIAINLSFFLMQLAIDVTNIIGTGLYQILTTDIVGGGGTISSDAASTGFTWTAIIATLLAGGIAVSFISFAGIGAVALMILPVLLGVVLSLLAAILTLLMRDALIIILVILAPVAFVAYLLPNTQNLFNQWRKGLTAILFLYPTAAILFGGSKAASQIIASSPGTDMNTIVALLVMAAPLGMLPWLAARGNPIMAKVGSSLQGLAKRGRDAAAKPLNNYAKEKMSQNLARRQAGTHNVFGARLSERAAAKKQSKLERGRGGRNIAEVFNQNKQQRHDDIEANKTIAKNNYNRRTERAAERMESGQKVSRSQRQAVNIANRHFDSGEEHTQLEEQRKDRMKQRVLNGAQSTTGSGQTLMQTQIRTAVDRENTAATEGRIANIVNDTAEVKTAQAAVDANKPTTERLEAERVERAIESTRNDSGQMAEVYKTAEAKLGTEEHQSVIDSNVEYAKTHGGALVPEAARGLQKQNATTQGKKDVLAARQSETATKMEELRSGEDFAGQNFYGTEAREDLRWSSTVQKANTNAQAEARSVGVESYAQDIINGVQVPSAPGNSPTASSKTVAEIAGGSVSGFGQDAARASAISLVNKERAERISNRMQSISREITAQGPAGRGYGRTELDASYATQDVEQIAAHLHALSGTGEGGVRLAVESVASALAAGTIPAGSQLERDLRDYVQAHMPDAKATDARLEHWASTGDQSVMAPGYSGGAHMDTKNDPAIAQQNPDSLYAARGILTQTDAARIMTGVRAGTINIKPRQRAMLETLETTGVMPPP